MPIIALPSTSPYYALKTVPLQRLLYEDYLDLDSTMHHKSHLFIYLFAIALPLCSTTYNRCTELWDANSSPSEGPIHPNLAFLCIPVCWFGLSSFPRILSRVHSWSHSRHGTWRLHGFADGSQPHRSILYGREGARALNIGDLSWASSREVWILLPLAVGTSRIFLCSHDGVRHLCFPLNSQFYSPLTIAWSVHDSHVTNAEHARFVFIL